MLTNPLYQGKIAHKDKLYEGLHDAIIEPDLWERVQLKLKAKSARRRGTQNDPERRVWSKGKLFDEAGLSMTPTHTSKTDRSCKSSDTYRQKRIYRYYISRTPETDKASSGWRLPAKTIHQLVQDAVLARIVQLATSTALSAASIQEVKARQDTILKWQADIAALQTPLDDTGTYPTPANNTPATDTKAANAKGTKAGAGALLYQLPKRVVLGTNSLTITLNPSAMAQILIGAADDIPDTLLTFTGPTTLRRRGVEGKLICGATQPEPDVALQRALAKAHIWHQALKAGTPLKHIAKSAQTSESYIRTRLVLATLSPKIQNAILQGMQPTELTIASIVKRRMPLD